MSNPAQPLKLSKSQFKTLKVISKSSSKQHRQVVQSKALLITNEGFANEQIARDLKVSPNTVRRWRRRFEQFGLKQFGEALKYRGRKYTVSDEKVEEILKLTLETQPEGQTHWSCRTTAQATGISKSTIQKIWSSRGLKPYLV